MNASFVCTVLVFFMMYLGVGLNTALAGQVDLVGRWDGTANVATDEGFSTSSVDLDVLSQEGNSFSGTMRFGDEAPFDVNGVLDKKSIRITGSVSIFEANISGRGVKRTIHGTGSRLESAAIPSATTVFDLYNKEGMCVRSGGTVETKLCCASAGDFPDTCSIGACGCPPAGSREAAICSCEPGRCFNGTKCVAR